MKPPRAPFPSCSVRRPPSPGCLWVRRIGAVFFLFTALAALGAGPPATFRADRILIRPRREVSPATMTQLHRLTGGRVLRAFPRLGGVQVVQLPRGLSVASAVALYRGSGLLAYAEPDYIVHALAEPNDFHYLNLDLWHLKNAGQYGGTPGADIHATAAWDTQTDASNIIVAVVDTGIRYTHEDLAANMWTNPGETGLDGNGLAKSTNLQDDDGDGFVDDVHGINAILGTGDPNDDYGHGTHVAGIIGAVGNNGVGVAGVAWRVQLMACKFIDASGNGSVSDAITCLDYARAHGAKIVNASWGSYSFTSSALRDAINLLRDAGIIFVAAAGNDANDNDGNSLYPASYEYDNIIAVAATDRTDALAAFSNYGGTTVQLAAPGSPVFSCWNGSDSDYRNFDGTSMAAPMVAGACALLEARYPGESTHQIMNRIFSTVDALPAMAGKTVTGGRLNVARALAPVPPPVVPADTPWFDDDLPAGAQTSANGDAWTWVTGSPASFSGIRAHQSGLAAGYHDHTFEKATGTLEVFPGDVLYTYVWLDPANPPREIMVTWNDGCWEHRAYWGDDLIPYGMDGTSDRRPMGGLPPTATWVRLEVPAHALGLEGAKLKGMSFALFDGKATWDLAGRRAGP